MLHYKCITISINTLDTAECLGTKASLASTILQSTKKGKVLDSFMFWGSIHFVDQNEIPVSLKIQCLTLGAHFSECIRYHQVGVTKVNLASKILKSTKKFKNFWILDCFGDPSSLLIKIKIQKSTGNIPWKFWVWWIMCTRHKPLCLEEPIQLWFYLPSFKSNQNWLLCIQ